MNSITNKNASNSSNSNNSSNSSNEIEKCKKILAGQMMIPMFSIKDLIVGRIGTVIPWVILLFIVAFIIII